MKNEIANEQASTKTTSKDKKTKTCSRTARENELISNEIKKLTDTINSIQVADSNATNGTAKTLPKDDSLSSEDTTIARRLNDQFARPNSAFFYKLTELTTENGSFRLKRLNEGVKPNTWYPFAVPVRNYARILIKLYGFEKGSLWSKLSTKDKEFKDDETITREEVIALAFVYRLNGEQLNALLKSLGYPGLYPRQTYEAALIFVLDTYQSSNKFERFRNPEIDISEEEFVCNYDFFYNLMKNQSKIDLSLMQSQYIKDFKERLTTVTIKGKKQPSLDTNKWVLTEEMLRDFIVSSTTAEKNNTLQCQSELSDIILEVNENEAFGNEAFFTKYLNSGSAEDGSNRERFVQNREKSHRYIVKMLYRFLRREKAKKNSPIKDCEGIRVSWFFKRFTINFLGELNMNNASELFIKEYTFIDEENRLIENFEKFCVDFFNKVLNCYTEEQQKLIKDLFLLYVKSVLNIKKKASEESSNKKADNPVVLTKCEMEACKKILLRDRDKDINTFSANHYAGFRKILLGESDVSRFLFILLYLFTFSCKDETWFRFDNEIIRAVYPNKGDHADDEADEDDEDEIKNSEYYGTSFYVSTGGSMDELNRWLLDSGFPILRKREYLYPIVEKYMNGFHDSYNSADYLNKILKNVLLHDHSLQILSKLHMSSYSLYSMEKVLLPSFE